MKLGALVLGALVCASPLLSIAQDSDVEGCTDSPLIQRMPGSSIHSCEHKEFDSVQMPVGKGADGNPTMKDIEGEKWYWDMGNRDGLSDVQVYRNFLMRFRQRNGRSIFRIRLRRLPRTKDRTTFSSTT